MKLSLKIALVYTSIFLLFLGYYTWQLTRTGKSPFETLLNQDGGAYGDLAFAFVRGHTCLFQKPDPNLDISLNPYLPSGRVPGTGFPWDSSYYRSSHDVQGGRLYLYFGATPALLFYCPVLLLTGGYMPSQCLVFLVISCLNLLVYACLLRILVSRHFTNVTLHLEALLLMTYGICNIMPYNQGRPYIYEAAIGTATTLTLTAFLFLLLALNPSGRQNLWLALASLSVGLDFGSRPTGITLYSMLLLMGLYLYKEHYRSKSFLSSVFSPKILALFLPSILCGLAIMGYNYSRFENPFEFGETYALNNGDVWGHPLFSLRNIPDGIWCYYLLPYHFVPQFPYVAAMPPYIEIPGIFVDGKEREDYTGLFTSYPICLLAFGWLHYARKLPDPAVRKLVTTWGFFASAWGVVITLLMTSWFAVTFRYEAELQLPLLLLTSLTLLLRRHLLGPLVIWERIVLSLLVVYSCYFGIAYGLTGFLHWIQTYPNFIPL